MKLCCEREFGGNNVFMQIIYNVIQWQGILLIEAPLLFLHAWYIGLHQWQKKLVRKQMIFEEMNYVIWWKPPCGGGNSFECRCKITQHEGVDVSVIYPVPWHITRLDIPDSKVHGDNMGPIWGRQLSGMPFTNTLLPGMPFTNLPAW